jgi:hypothetical protein
MKKVWLVLLGHFILSAFLVLMTMKVNESGTLFFFEPRTWTVMVIVLLILNLPGATIFWILGPLLPGLQKIGDFFPVGDAYLGSYLLVILTTETIILLLVLLFRKILKFRNAT